MKARARITRLVHVIKTSWGDSCPRRRANQSSRQRLRHGSQERPGIEAHLFSCCI